MRTKGLIYAGLISLLCLSFSCGQEKDDTPGPTENIDFQFSLLNENDLPATTFEPGENFVFRFLMINRSDQHVWFRSFDNTDFCRVIQLQDYNPQENNNQQTDMGKPYVNMFCNYRNGNKIISGDTLKLQIQWMPTAGSKYDNPFFCKEQDTSPLGAGLYRTSFQSSFIFSAAERDFESAVMSFDITFEIE